MSLMSSIYAPTRKTEMWVPRKVEPDSDERLANSYFVNPRVRLDAVNRLCEGSKISPELRVAKARALYELERFHEARDEFREYLNLKPNDRQVMLWLAQVERALR